MAMIGMDVQQVRELATQFGAKADAIDDIITEITNRLNSTEWKGFDADQFRTDWNTNLTNDLRKVANALRTAQQQANRNAQDQENTSNAL